MYWNLVVFGLLIGVAERLSEKEVKVFRIPLVLLPFVALVMLVPYVIEAYGVLGFWRTAGTVAAAALGPFLIVIGALFAIILVAGLLARLSSWLFWFRIRFAMWRVQLTTKRRLRKLGRARVRVQHAIATCDSLPTRADLVRIDQNLAMLQGSVSARLDTTLGGGSYGRPVSVFYRFRNSRRHLMGNG